MHVAGAVAGLGIAVLAAGCTPDVAVDDGVGGGRSTSASTGATGTTASSASTGATTASTSSGPMGLPPCGAVVDDFDVATDGWLGNPDIQNGVARITVATTSHFATYKTSVAAPSDCFVSVDFAVVAFLGASTTIAVGLTDGLDSAWVYAGFDGVDVGTGISSDGVTTESQAPAMPGQLAVVLHGSDVVFLIAGNAGWTPIGITNRKPWMDSDTRLEFGVAGPSGTTVDFDNFSLATISDADLE